jgi:CheY-like chemotaxis protein
VALILVVEDELLVRELAVADLEDAGFEVMDAGNGDAATDLLKAGCNPDLIFTDIRMPGSIDGWTLTEIARRTNPELPVIYTSGLSYLSNGLRENERFIAKPYRPDRLLELINDLGVTA